MKKNVLKSPFGRKFKTKQKIILYSIFIILISLTNCRSHKKTQSDLRIVSLAPSITGILVELGMSENISGATDYCRIPEKNVTRIGGFNSFNFEIIASLRPTHIFCIDSTQKEVLDNMRKIFGNDKIYPFVHPESFDEIFKMTKEIGTVLNKEEIAYKITETQKQELELLKNENKQSGLKPSVIIELYYPPFYSAGKHTFLTDIIETAGGVNILETETKWPVLSLEEMYKLKPDIVLKLNHNPIDASLLSFHAYKNEAVFQPEDIDIFLQPGINSVKAVKELKEYITGRINNEK